MLLHAVLGGSKRPDVVLKNGDRVASYVIEATLGEGGMGKVFRARSEPDGRNVALKVLKAELADDEVYRRRFLHEARAAREVQHKHIVPVLDAGDADGYPYLAMPYLPGGSLTECIKTDPPLDTLLRLVMQIASGLDALHNRGILHRDIKPSNILLNETGAAAITDFGLARGYAYTVLTRLGQVMGTVDYLAPELIRGGPASPASDLYALGCLFFECLSGSPPFAGKSVYEIGLAHLSDPPPDPCAKRPDVPQELASAVLQALEKDPGRRPATATAYARMLVIASRQSRKAQRAAQTIRLVVSSGPLSGQSVEVAADLVVGRHNADLILPDLEVSRRHALIRPVAGGIEIEDLGSSNGTYVNGRRIGKSTLLAPGDQIQLGQSHLRVEIGPPPAAAELQRPPPAAAARPLATEPPRPAPDT
jgi:serine/threonine-protein kinase